MPASDRNPPLEPGPLAEFGRPGCHMHGASLDEAPADILFRALRRSLDVIRTITNVASGGVAGLSEANAKWLTRILARRLNDFEMYLALPGRSTKEIMHAAGFHATPISGDSFFGTSYTEVAVQVVIVWRRRLLASFPGKRDVSAIDLDLFPGLGQLIQSIRPTVDMELIACGLHQEWMRAAANWTQQTDVRPRADKSKYSCDPSVPQDVQRMVELLNGPPRLSQRKASEKAAVETKGSATSIEKRFRHHRDKTKKIRKAQ